MSFGTKTASPASETTTAAASEAKPKGVAAVSKEEFLEVAEALECNVAGMPVILEPSVFSSGSYGFKLPAPPAIHVKINGKAVRLCLSMSLVVANSKPKG